jgi:Tol biopolymer transport system component
MSSTKHRRYKFFFFLIPFILVACRQEQHIPQSELPSPPSSHAEASNLRGTIVFQSNRDGDWEIYAMNADGSQFVQLTQNVAVDKLPVWSPDGREIAFTSNRDGNFEVYVMQADGSQPCNITHHPALDEAPAWSPDGKQIVFHSDRHGKLDIYAMQKNGDRVRQITKAPGRNALPAWSPQGDWFAYTSNRELGWHIYLRQFDDAQTERRITTGCRPAWSPDGQALAHVSDRGNRNDDLRFVMLDGENARFLTTDPQTSESEPAWSPDGRYIVYAKSRKGPLNRSNIYVVSRDGTQQYQLTDTTARDQSPDWTRRELYK